jgi:glycosyltransferase involved in cell wall biosynthesis
VTVLQRLPRIIVPDNGAQELLTSFGLDPQRMAIIPYGVSPSTDPFDGLDSADADLRRVREIRAGGRQVICCIGTVGPRKNQRLLIDALAEIPADRRPFCVVVGEGEVAALTLFARARGVADSVKFCGHKPDARRFLREADCVVFPAINEGLPLTLLEALCDRVPVIVSEAPEVSDVVRHGESGLIFAADDTLALAGAIQELLALTPQQRADLRQQAHQTYRTRFTANAMFDRYMTEYTALLDGAAAPRRLKAA